jgi:hypothetical protein
MSQIVEKSSQIGQKLPRAPLGGLRLGEKRGNGPAQICSHLYRTVALTGTNVLASHLYGSESPPGTNVRHLYRVGGRWRQRAPVRGHLYRAVAPPDTNVII